MSLKSAPGNGTTPIRLGHRVVDKSGNAGEVKDITHETAFSAYMVRVAWDDGVLRPLSRSTDLIHVPS